MPLGMEVCLSPDEFVLDGDPAPYPKRVGSTRNFWPISNVAKRLHGSRCRDIARPRPKRHCVQCGPSYSQKIGHTHPTQFFGLCLLWPNGWMDEDAAWYGSRPRPRQHCTRGVPSSCERGTAAPLFSAHVYCGHDRPSQLLLSSCN